jgi:hypothetical protein
MRPNGNNSQKGKNLVLKKGKNLEKERTQKGKNFF